MEHIELAQSAFGKFVVQIHGGVNANHYRRHDEVVKLFLRLNPNYEFARKELSVGGEKYAVSRSEWNRLYRLDSASQDG